jgi:hypothetical protein
VNVNDGTEPCPYCGTAHHPSAIKAYWQGRDEGAAVAFGLLGMAVALRDVAERMRRKANICPKCGKRFESEGGSDDRDGSYLCWCSDDEPAESRGTDE